MFEPRPKASSAAKSPADSGHKSTPSSTVRLGNSNPPVIFQEKTYSRSNAPDATPRSGDPCELDKHPRHKNLRDELRRPTTSKSPFVSNTSTDGWSAYHQQRSLPVRMLETESPSGEGVGSSLTIAEDPCCPQANLNLPRPLSVPATGSIDAPVDREDQRDIAAPVIENSQLSAKVFSAVNDVVCSVESEDDAIKQSVDGSSTSDDINQMPVSEPIPEQPLNGNENSIFQLLKRIYLWEPNLAAGMTRVRWRCSCGKELWDDFKVLRRGSEEDFKRKFDYPTNGIRSRAQMATAGNTAPIQLGNISPPSTSRSGSNKTSLSPADQTLAAPPPNSPVTQSTTARQFPASSSDPLHLLLCHTDGLYSVGLTQLPIHDLKSDEQLFQKLRTTYESLHRWQSILSFRSLTRIKFVRFEMYGKSRVVDVRKENDLPPPGHVEYRYAPAPPEMLPPVGENMMMHFYYHPEHAEDNPDCLERLPKKLLGRLEVDVGKSRATGWGLQYEEGPNTSGVAILVFLLFGLGSIVFGVVWSVEEHDVQSAFSISAVVIAIGALFLVVLQAAMQEKP